MGATSNELHHARERTSIRVLAGDKDDDVAYLAVHIRNLRSKGVSSKLRDPWPPLGGSERKAKFHKGILAMANAIVYIWLLYARTNIPAHYSH